MSYFDDADNFLKEVPPTPDADYWFQLDAESFHKIVEGTLRNIAVLPEMQRGIPTPGTRVRLYVPGHITMDVDVTVVETHGQNEDKPYDMSFSLDSDAAQTYREKYEETTDSEGGLGEGLRIGGNRIVFEEHRRPASTFAVNGELDALRESVRKLHDAQRAQEQEIAELQNPAPIGPMKLVRYALARLRKVMKCI